MAEWVWIEWEKVYEVWKRGMYNFQRDLDVIEVETVYVDYRQEGQYFYGYDWLRNTDAIYRKRLIKDNIIGFLLFTRSTNKGTMRTIELLSEAQTAEERAAVWIAATAFELMGARYNREISKQARILHHAATLFLSERFCIWHHSMKRLVPEVLVSPCLIDHIQVCDAGAIIGLIQTNMDMLQGNYTALLYSSLKEGEKSEHHSVRLTQFH